MLFFLILTLSSLRLPAQRFGFTLDNDRYAEIPFTLINNLIVIDVVLNDQLPLRFIVDTGVRNVIITEKKITDLIEADYSRTINLRGAGEAELVKAYVSNSVSISTTGLRSENHSMLILEEDYLRLVEYVGEKIHGIIGYELFSNYVVNIDYDEQILRIIHPDIFRKPRHGYRDISITVEDTKPYINTRMLQKNKNPQPLKLLIDTGASQALLLEKSSDPDIYIPDKNIYTSLGRGLSGEVTGHIARVNYFSVSDFCFKEVVTSFPDDINYNTYSLETERNGTLGGDILSRFNVYLDYQNEVMYLRKGHRYSKDFDFDMSGLTIKTSYWHPYFEVAHVREGSAGALAGIKVGDMLIKVNGMKTSMVQLSTVIKLFRSKEGKKIRLQLVPQGKMLEDKRKIKFYLKRQI